jgi:hypothetical protein
MVGPREEEFTLQANAWGLDAFQDAFGISPRICVIVWRRCRLNKVVPGIGVNQFLWALAFLRIYSTHTILREMIDKPAEQVFTTWVWDVVKAVANAFEEVVRKLFLAPLIVDCCVLSHFLFLYVFFIADKI